MISHIRHGEAASRVWLAGVFCLTSLFVSACDKVDLTAPTGSTITLSAGTTVLPLGGSTQIIATVREISGTAVNDGTTVTFSSSLGNVDPREAQTSNGQVVVTFLAGSQSGTADVHAISGSATTTGGTTGTTTTPGSGVRILVGGAAADRITLTAAPSSVPASGGSVELIATVADVSGNPLPGAPVSFTSTTGSLSQASATTDGQGQARTRLTTNIAASVTARVATKDSNTVAITVSAGPTVSVTSAPANPVVGQPVIFTVTATTPAGGTGLSPVDSLTVTSVFIDFGDGSSATLGTASTQAVSHVYRQPGTYTASVSATDDTGQRNSATTVITVAPVSVTIAVTPTTPAEDTVITFTATIAGAAQPVIDRYEWAFGDGGVLTTSGNIATHVYSTPGVRTVTVTIFAATGASASGTVIVDIAPAAPVSVTLTGPAGPVIENETVANFTATVAPTGAPVQSYEWSFGDGSGTTTSSGQASHIYRSSGFRTVSVTVETTDGRTASSSIAINVLPQAPVSVNLSADDPTPELRQLVEFTAAVTAGTNAQIARYEWEFDTGGARATTSGNVTQHSYNTAGRKTITVVVTTTDGRTGTGRTVVQVSPP